MTTLVNNWAAKIVDAELRQREKAAADTPEE